MRLEVDLELSTVVGDRTVRGRLVGRGEDLVLSVDTPEAFAGARDAALVRRAARVLHDIGIRLHVRDSAGTTLLVLGDVRAGWHRMATRSPYMRMGGARGVLTGLRGRSARRDPLLPQLADAPPGTPYPLVPTFQRRPRRPLTTTHQRGGSPRLIVAGEAPDPSAVAGHEFGLRSDVTVLGSDPDCDIVLPRLAPQHLEVRHTEDDEYVVRALAPARVHGEFIDETLLRSSARVEAGEWTLVYARDEHADHGRPYGGRIGGELGYQRTQRPRSEPTAREE